jgi:hypothetical protein
MAPKQKRRKFQSDDSVKAEEVDEERRMAEEAKVFVCLLKCCQWLCGSVQFSFKICYFFLELIFH